jgi:hypothetical protein
MAINIKLKPNIDWYEYYYDCPHDVIVDFLLNEKDFLKRQSLAITAIEKIMRSHKKQLLLGHVSELARIEHGIRELEPWVRDHVVHAMLSYLLGIFINENFIYDLTGERVDQFQWKLAGLFHDIGYPAQIAKDLLKSYTDRINEIANTISLASQEIHFNIVPVGLDRLQNDVNSFDLMQKYLDKWDLNINAKAVYDISIQKGNICHGMISALCVLYIIDLLYQENNPSREVNDYSGWSQHCFTGDVVSACTAIFIHNLPSEYFKHSKISLDKAPIAYLLKLSDCLQDWERPSKNNKHGFPANSYDIDVVNKTLFFSAPAERKEKITDEVVSCLIDENIEIT